MNITDFLKELRTREYTLGGDTLDKIFARQTELMDRYHPIEKANGLLQTEDVPVDLNDRFGQQRLKDFMERIIEELMEAANCLKNKPWKQTHMVTDEVHYKEELIDAFHFFIELLILSGIGPEELYDFYFAKSKVNEFRQESGY